MTIRIRESDGDVDPVALDSPQFDELDWDADPMRVLERAEEESGINCFGQPIN